MQYASTAAQKSVTLMYKVITSYLTFIDTGCAKLHGELEYCIITFKIELRRKFLFVYPS